MFDLRKALIKLAYDTPSIRADIMPLLSEDEEVLEEKAARFEEGVPADPTENMSPEDAEK